MNHDEVFYLIRINKLLIKIKTKKQQTNKRGRICQDQLVDNKKRLMQGMLSTSQEVGEASILKS